MRAFPQPCQTELVSLLPSSSPLWAHPWYPVAGRREGQCWNRRMLPKKNPSSFCQPDQEICCIAQKPHMASKPWITSHAMFHVSWWNASLQMLSCVLPSSPPWRSVLSFKSSSTHGRDSVFWLGLLSGFLVPFLVPLRIIPINTQIIATKTGVRVENAIVVGLKVQ